jgi:hypothetical protein
VSRSLQYAISQTQPQKHCWKWTDFMGDTWSYGRAGYTRGQEDATHGLLLRLVNLDEHAVRHGLHALVLQKVKQAKRR